MHRSIYIALRFAITWLLALLCMGIVAVAFEGADAVLVGNLGVGEVQ